MELEQVETTQENTRQEDAKQQDPGTVYDIHLYAVVRVKVIGVRAASHENAMEKAEEQANLGGLFSILDDIIPIGRDVEYAEEVLGFLIDEQGDVQHETSRYYCRHGECFPLAKNPCACGSKE